MKKLITFGLSAATALSMTGGALMPVAGALTIAELQAQIATLTAQIAAMGGSASGCYAFTVDLTEGSTGADVTALQNYLAGTGHFTATATGFFGPVTKAAVAAWQTANGVAPAYGYFGPVSRAKYNTVCTPAEEEETTSDDLEGGAGSVSQYELDSSLNNEEVGEGEEDVMVYGLEMEADDGSDLELTAVRLDFNQTTATNDDLEDFITEVSIWLGDEEFARVDADTFIEDNAWEKTVSLDDGAVIKAGETETLYVAVSGVGNLDTADALLNDWSVDAETVRYVDAQGASTSEDPGTGARTFALETFAAATDIEMKVSTGDEAVSEAHVIDIDATDDTEEESIFAFDVEVEGDSDLTVDDIEVGLVVSNGLGDDLDEIASALYLFMDGEEVGQENIPADGVVVVLFDDLDLELPAGETYEFVVKADLISIADGVVDGDTIEGDIVDNNTDNWDVEDEDGEELVDGDKTGTADGEAHALFDNGVMATFVSSDADETFTGDTAGEFDQGTFLVTFKAEAFGADMRIDRSCEEGGADAPGQGVEYTITNSGSNATTCVLTSSSSDTEDNANVFEVDEGTTRTFTLQVTATASADAYAEVSVDSINWGTATNDTNANYYTFNLSEFKTGALSLDAV